MKTFSLAVTSMLAGILSLSTPAVAQGVGGFSAGPGLAPPQETSVPAAPAATPPPDRPVEQVDAPAQTPEEENDEDQPYETRVISYKKSPTFTQDRQFTNTRVWVLDPGRYTVEQWWTGSYGVPKYLPSDTKNLDGHFFQTEIEMGIAKHVQVDIYFNYEFGQNDTGGLVVAQQGHTGVAAEVRYAIPDYWGQVWGNPTLYFEVTSQYYNSPRVEGRLLLGGSMFTPRLMGAVNFSFERNIFRDSRSGIDYEIKSQWGANYDIIPGWFRAGAEATFGWDSHGTIDSSGNSLIYPVAQIGPEVLFTIPSRFFKVLATVLLGLADHDYPYQPQIIASCSF